MNEMEKKGPNCRIGEMGVVWDENWPITRPVAWPLSTQCHYIGAVRSTIDISNLNRANREQFFGCCCFLLPAFAAAAVHLFIVFRQQSACVCWDKLCQAKSRETFCSVSLFDETQTNVYRQEEDEDQKNLGGRRKKKEEEDLLLSQHTRQEEMKHSTL